MSLSSQQGQIIKGPGNHMKALGLYPEGSVDRFQQRTGLVSRVYYVPALCQALTWIASEGSTQQPWERHAVVPTLRRETKPTEGRDLDEGHIASR